MNCHNCGAAMTLIESRRYFRCGHCGTYAFPNTIDADGLRIVGQAPDASATKCPVCAVPMAHAVLDDRHPVDFCARCRGVLLPRETFALVTSTRRAWATSPPVQPLPLDRQELHRALACPRCGGRFETYPFLGPGNVVIDNCTRCDLIWLDFGELRQIADAPGADRGRRHVPRVDDAWVRRGPMRDTERDDEPDALGALGFLTSLVLKD